MGSWGAKKNQFKFLKIPVSDYILIKNFDFKPKIRSRCHQFIGAS